MIEQLKNILDGDNILTSEYMKDHTTFHIGGKVPLMLLPKSEEQIAEILKLCSQQKKDVLILGGGANILYTDKELDKVVIKLGKNFSKTIVDGETLTAEAGIKMKDISNIAMENSLEGLEFASGIPGTLGGGTYMNAGAYDGELRNIITKVHTVDFDGNKKVYTNEELEFGYRKSILMTKKEIITKVEIKLAKGDREKIKEKIEDLSFKRDSKQPLSEYSAGSTFKRPKDNYASKLIEEAGLKGFSIGEAKVSEKHSGFVINKGECSFDDMKRFIAEVKRIVFENSGIMLEEEVRIIEE